MVVAVTRKALTKGHAQQQTDCITWTTLPVFTATLLTPMNSVRDHRVVGNDVIDFYAKSNR